MPPDFSGRSILRWREIAKEKRRVRVEQTASEMVLEVLARQAEALSGETGRPLEETSAEVLRTPAGRLLGELAEGSHPSRAGRRLAGRPAQRSRCPEARA